MYNYLIFLSAKLDKKNKSWVRVVDKLERILNKGKLNQAAIHYDLGIAYGKLKKWESAANKLSLAVKFNPNNLSWKYRYAVALENSGKKEQSNELINSIFNDNSTNPAKHFKSGMLLLGYSRPYDAEKSFRKSIELDEKNYKNHLGLVISLNKQGKGKSWIAIESLEKAVALNPTATEIHYSLGLNYEYMKNYYLASSSYIKALLSHNKNRENINSILDKLKSGLQDKKIKENISLSQKSYQEGLKHLDSDPAIAESLFREAIQNNNGDPEYYINLASSLEKQGEGKLWQELEALQSALEKGIIKPAKMYRVGLLREKLKNYSSAQSAYQLAIDEGYKSSEIYYHLGYCLEMIGQDRSSIEAYKLAIKFDKKLNSTAFGIGVFHSKHGHKELAIKAFNAQLESFPNNSELHFKLGMIYDRNYQWNDAKKSFKRAIKINSSIFEWHFRLGFIFEKQENYKEAAYWYEKAATGRSRHTPYWYYRLGYVLVRLGNYKDACDAFIKNNSEFIPNELTENINDCFAVKKFKQSIKHELNNEFEKSIACLRESLHSREGSGEYIHYRIGCNLYKMGRFEEASKSFINIRTLSAAHGVSDKKYREDSTTRKFSDYRSYYEQKEVKENTIIYESFQGASISCNPLAIFLHLQKDHKYRNYKHYWVINDTSCIPDHLKETKNVDFVHYNSDLYLELLATSKILINNSTFQPYFVKKENQVYINTWHGTPLKTLGKDMKGRFLEHKNFTRNILQSDLLISPNKFTTEILKNSHDINGIYTGKLLECGYPRIDQTLLLSQYRKQKIRDIIQLNDNEKVIFYAPTWRGVHGEIDINKEKLISDLKSMAELANAKIIFRGHSLLESVLGELSISGVTVLPKSVDTNEFLAISDILITDYSSIFFDFFPTKRPVFYYAYDLNEYIESRGLYLDLKELPGKVCYDIDTLKLELKNSINNNENLKNMDRLSEQSFNNHDDGKATTRVVHAINQIIKDKKDNQVVAHKTSSDSKSFLFYTGPFMRNGITTSFINLANTLISLGHTVSVVVDANAIAKHSERLEQISKLSSSVNLIGRVGGIVFTLEERFIHGERNRDQKFTNDEMQDRWLSSWRFEYRRIFGNAKFDCIINFEGYTNFWSSLFSAQNNIPRSIYQHNDMYGEYTQKYPYLLSIFSNYKNYDNVISVSKETRNLNLNNISKLIEIEENKFIHSENLLNIDTIFKLAEEDISQEDYSIFAEKGPTFINIGRLSIEKDHSKLLRSFSDVLHLYPSAKLIILGDGALKSDLLILASELNINKSVHFLGHRLNPYPYLRLADCFVLSSNHEGQPMTLLEALTLDKDIIATNIPGNNSVLKLVNEQGVVNTKDGLATALITYCKSGKHQQKFNYVAYQEEAINSFISHTH